MTYRSMYGIMPNLSLLIIKFTGYVMSTYADLRTIDFGDCRLSVTANTHKRKRTGTRTRTPTYINPCLDRCIYAREVGYGQA